MNAITGPIGYLPASITTWEQLSLTTPLVLKCCVITTLSSLYLLIIFILGAELDTLNAYLGGGWNSELPDSSYFCETTGPRRVSGGCHDLINRLLYNVTILHVYGIKVIPESRYSRVHRRLIL